MSKPDTLVNALVRRKNGQGLRRVIRDDGANGLQVSNPNDPAQMRPVSREEFVAVWEVVKTPEEQSAGDINLTTFGTETAPKSNVTMNTQEITKQFTSEVTSMADEPRLNETPFGGRAEDTDREAMKEAILNTPVSNTTSTGEPVAGNEDPNELLEEDRMDKSLPEDEQADAMSEEAPKKTTRRKKG